MIRGRVPAIIAVIVVLGPAPGIDVVDIASIDRRPVNIGTIGSIRPVADARSIVNPRSIADPGTVTDTASDAADCSDASNPADSSNATRPSRSVGPIGDSGAISGQLRRPIPRTGSVADTATNPGSVANSGSIGRQLRGAIAARDAGSVAAGLWTDPTGRRACAGTRAGSIGRQL